MRVNIGDVILVPYGTYSGEIKNAVFLVIYHEAYDGNRSSSDFTGIKISSHEYHYGILLKKDFLPFLHHDSYINCNQQHRFSEDQVIKRLGEVNKQSMFNILQQLKNYNAATQRKLNQFIGSYQPTPYRADED